MDRKTMEIAISATVWLRRCSAAGWKKANGPLLAKSLPGNTMTRMGKPSGLVYVPWNVIWQPT